MNKKLLAIGEALIDFIPDRAGCEFSEVTAFSPKVGGAPANVSAAFAALGGRAALLTALGEDGFGHRIAGELSAAGVDTSGIVFTDRANTALAFVSLGKGGERSFSFYRNPSADMLFSPADIDPVLFSDAFALHFCSVSLGDFPMKKAHRAAIVKAKEAGALISFDPNLRFPLWKEKEELYRAVWEFLPASDILKISDEELLFLTGTEKVEEALPVLFAGRVRLILFTKGKRGASAYLKREDGALVSRSVPGVLAETVDTTGAGDGFIGAFLFCLSEVGVIPETLAGLSEEVLEEALAFANRFAAASTAYYGAIPAYRQAAEKSRGR